MSDRLRAGNRLAIPRAFPDLFRDLKLQRHFSRLLRDSLAHCTAGGSKLR